MTSQDATLSAFKILKDGMQKIDRAGIYLLREAPLAALVFHNPSRLNALTFEMWQQLLQLLGEVENDHQIRALWVLGSGDKAFVSGADISEFETVRTPGEPARRYDAVNSAAFAALRNCQIPTLAMIRGYCMGGGFGIAAACDLRISDESGRFSLPPARLGLGYPPDAFVDIISSIGPTKTKELLLTARILEASEALEIGFINSLTKEDKLEHCVSHILGEICANAPLSHKASKSAVRAVLEGTSESWSRARTAADSCFDSEDYREGVNAFAQKRNPKFNGR